MTGSADGRIYPGTVCALAEYNGQLIAGGAFGVADGTPAPGVAAWDGSQWRPLGSGTNGLVQALTVYDGRLIVGGWFTTAGGLPCQNLAAWNGVEWAPLTAEMSAYDSAPMVLSLGTFGGDLVVGGWFDAIDGVSCRRIARFDGFSWHAFGSGVEGSGGAVYALCEYHGALIAGGNFTTAGGRECNGIAAWDGAWHCVGGGMHNLAWPQGTPSPVYSLVVLDGALIVGGSFTHAGALPTNSIARWSTWGWEPLDVAGQGVEMWGSLSTATSMAVVGRELSVAGFFSRAGGQGGYNGVARWGFCPSDIDDGSGAGACDGGTDINDLLFFLVHYEAGESAQADLDDGTGTGMPDGGVDINDLLFFLAHYETGC